MAYLGDELSRDLALYRSLPGFKKVIYFAMMISLLIGLIGATGIIIRWFG